MIDFQHRRNIKKWLYSGITFWVLIILVIFVGKQVYDIYGKNKISREGLDSATKEYDDLKSRENMLSSEIDRLKTSAGIEAEIRDKFSVAKPGEQVVMIVDSSSSENKSEVNGEKGLWQKILDLFK